MKTYRVQRGWPSYTHHPEAKPVGKKSVAYVPYPELPEHWKTERLDDNYQVWVETEEAARAMVTARIRKKLWRAAQDIVGAVRHAMLYNPDIVPSLPKDFRDFIKMGAEMEGVLMPDEYRGAEV